MTVSDKEMLVAIPPAEERVWLALLSGTFAAFFWSVYWAADWYTGTLQSRHRVDFAFEAQIPFWPWAILAYLTITPILLLLPFRLRSRVHIAPVFATLCLQVVIAGVIFVVFPVELGYPREVPTGLVAIPFTAAKTVNLHYNAVPSLHVAFALTAAAALTQVGGTLWRSGIWIWSLLIVVSTLVTHQHHILDVATGALLSWTTKRWVCPRLATVSSL
jgi:membrane-associated phospholipid phosphatase